MIRRCICYAVDPGFLFPAVASALQLRRVLLDSIADILIFVIGTNSVVQRDFGDICASNDILLKSIPSETLDGHSGLYANLFLDRFVPDVYTQIIYVDADVQFWGQITDFIEIMVPEGQFFATVDPMTFEMDGPGRRSRDLQTYMNGLGISRSKQTYFNTGVMYINRVGWNELSKEALSFLIKRPGLCRFYDQSALNAVASTRHKPLSLRWNFPIFFRNFLVEGDIVPTIYHFMSQPKPWHGSFPPWDITFTRPYAAALRSAPHLAAYVNKLSPLNWARYTAQQQIKRIEERISWSRRREEILRYEAMTYIPARKS